MIDAGKSEGWLGLNTEKQEKFSNGYYLDICIGDWTVHLSYTEVLIEQFRDEHEGTSIMFFKNNDPEFFISFKGEQ